VLRRPCPSSSRDRSTRVGGLGQGRQKAIPAHPSGRERFRRCWTPWMGTAGRSGNSLAPRSGRRPEETITTSDGPAFGRGENRSWRDGRVCMRNCAAASGGPQRRSWATFSRERDHRPGLGGVVTPQADFVLSGAGLSFVAFAPADATPGRSRRRITSIPRTKVCRRGQQ